MPEIDENQLAGYRQVAEFVQKGMANPKLRRQLMEIQKELYPNLPNEVDVANPVLERVDALAKLIEDDKKERQERDAELAEENQKSTWERQWLTGRKKLTDSGVNPEGIEAVEKLMTERSIADHEAGWALFERLNPPPPPPMSGSSRFNWFEGADKQPDLQQLFNQDYDGFLGKAIDSARRDFKSGGAG